jgi:signal peptide peptidase SppA
MKLLDVITSPWAIEPSKLLEIQAIYATHLRGEKIDIAGVEARIGKPLINEPKSYTVQDGVALVSLDGVLAKRANMMMQISGGTSMQTAARDLQQAAQDPAVHSIILMIDSPGGTVDGTQTLADVVTAVGQTKPVVALASGTMASAAYWVGSAASKIYITDSTTAVGSIGVVATHMDVSGQQATQGVKTTEIFAGKFKRIASQYAPLSKEGRATMQQQVDYTYSLFVQAVAEQRGISVDTVLQDMAEGQIFLGQQAIDAGLVDGVSTLDALIASLNNSRATGAAASTRRAGAAAKTTQGKPTMTITREELAAQAPELLQAVLAEGQAAGAVAERDRIQSVMAQAVAGHDQLVKALAFDGKSTAGDAAMAILAAERSTRSAQAKALAFDAPDPLNVQAAPTVTAPEAGAKSKAQIDTEAKALVKENPGMSYVQAVTQLTGA